MNTKTYFAKALLSAACGLAAAAATAAAVTLTEDKTVGAGETYTTDHDLIVGTDSAHVTLKAENGGAIVNTFQGGRNRGPWVYNGSAIKVTGEGSSLTTHQMFARQGGRIEVTDGATLVHNRSTPSSYTEGQTPGTVFIDGGVLAPRMPTTTLGDLQTGNVRVFAEWFYRYSDFTLGENGLTLDVPERAFAVLCPTVKSAAAGATVVKTGGGIADFDFVNSPVALDVREGALRQSHRSTRSKLSEAKTLAIGSATTPYALRGDHVATGTAFRPSASGAGLRFEASSGFSADAWNRYGNYAKILQTGEIVLTEDTAEPHCGAVYLKEKVDVTKSFVLTFDYLGAIGGDGNPYEGFVAVWQNCSDGKFTTGEVGYIGSDFTSSFACGLRFRSGGFRVGKNGAWIYTDGLVNNAEIFKAAGTPENRASCRMTYDAAEKTMKFEIYSNLLGALSHVEENVDLRAITGADTAWFGFTGAGDGSRRLDVILSNVSIVSPGAELAHVNQGGTINLSGLSAGDTFNVKLATSLRQRGFGMDALAYADGVELDVRDAGAIPSTEDAAKSARLAIDSITGEGRLVKKGAADLAVRNAGNDATLRIADGRLVLSDESAQPPTSATMAEHWVFADGTPDTYGASGSVEQNGTIQFGADYPSGNRNAAFYSIPVKVDAAWTLQFTLDLTANEKGLSFALLLNRPSAGLVAGGGNTDGGFAGHGTVVNWCIWKDNADCGKVNVEQWDNGTTVPNWQNGTPVLSLVNAVTDITVSYDPDSGDITVRTERDGTSQDAVFHRNPARYAEDGFVYLGFGTSGGGSSAAIPRISNISFTTASEIVRRPYFRGLDLGSDTTTVVLDPYSAGEKFIVAQTLTSSGGTLALASESSDSAVATVGSVSGEATVVVPAGMAFEVAGDMSSLDLVLEGGANLVVAGQAVVHSLTYAGEKMRGSFGPTGSPSWMAVAADARLKILVPLQGLSIIVR